MYSSLDKIDIVSLDKATGQKIFTQTEHRTSQEMAQEEELSVLFALTRVINSLDMVEDGQPAPCVRYAASEVPPTSVEQAIASAGGQLEVDLKPQPYQGPRADAAELADRAFASLATRVLSREAQAMEERALEHLEATVTARQPNKDTDEIAHWTAVMEIAAVGGELLRGVAGGRWIQPARRMSTVPFAFECGDGAVFNVAGKAERFLATGERDSVRHLLRVAEERAQGEPAPGPVMVTFKPGSWELRDEMVCRRLLDTGNEAASDLPLIVYGNDNASSFSMLKKNGTAEKDMDALHSQAMKNLARVQVEFHELDLEGLKILVVSGDYYAAEKVLDVSFMRQMHARLGAPVLAAGLPRKGVLMLTHALVPAQQMGVFLHVVASQHAEEQASQPLSKTPVIIQDGHIHGVIREGHVTAGQTARSPQKKRNLFDRLFRRKR